jgi:hypothetical protein
MHRTPVDGPDRPAGKPSFATSNLFRAVVLVTCIRSSQRGEIPSGYRGKRKGGRISGIESVGECYACTCQVLTLDRPYRTEMACRRVEQLMGSAIYCAHCGKARRRLRLTRAGPGHVAKHARSLKAGLTCKTAFFHFCSAHLSYIISIYPGRLHTRCAS